MAFAGRSNVGKSTLLSLGFLLDAWVRLKIQGTLAGSIWHVNAQHACSKQLEHGQAKLCPGICYFMAGPTLCHSTWLSATWPH